MNDPGREVRSGPLKLVATQYHTSPTSVKRWSHSFSWQARLTGIERTIQERLRGDTEDRVFQERKISLKLVKANESRYAKKMLDNPEAHMINSMADLVAAAKLKLLLLEEPTEKIDHTGDYVVITNVPEQDLD